MKRQGLVSDLPINTNIVYDLTGIGSGMIRTQGDVRVLIHGVPIHFQVVDNDFPIKETGILGLSFLKKQEITLKFRDTLPDSLQFGKGETFSCASSSHDLPPRTKVLITVPTNSTNASGYVRKIDTGPGIFVGEALVSQENGLAKLYVINTTADHVILTIPSIELEEFHVVPPAPRSCRTGNPDVDSSRDRAQRLAQLIKVLDLNHLGEDERTNILEIVNEFSYQFHLSTDRLGSSNVTQHIIVTTDEIPINTKQYRFPQIHKSEIETQVNSLLNSNIIQASASPYNSPVWIVPKKSNSSGEPRWRMVIDYRKLNDKTVGDAYPLPNITEILDQLGGAKYFSTLDLASGFHQIPVDPISKAKTAFSTPHGHYEFNRMPFGLKNAPATFQRVMDLVLSGLQGIELFVYMDDIVIYADSLEEHARKLRTLLARLQNSGLTLQPEKCRFLQREISYLGHVITREGVKPDPGKIRAVKQFPVPKTKKNIKQFLGLVGYYRRFILNMAKIAKPLTKLLKQDIPFCWTSGAQVAFETLRDIICLEPLLQFPNFSQPFLVTTDASNFAVGAILSQGSIGKDLPIAYASRTLNDAETNYSTIEKELLAVLYAVEYFRPYLYGQQFTLVTDHRPLVWLHSAKDPTSKIMRWRIRLNEYDYNIVYKPGKINANADALSRNPVDLNLNLNSQSQPVLMDTDSNPGSRDLERVLICADKASIAGSEVDRVDDEVLCFENEKIVASVFLARGKAAAECNEVIDGLRISSNVLVSTLPVGNESFRGSPQSGTMHRLGRLLTYGNSQPREPASGAVRGSQCSARVPALCSALEGTSQGSQDLGSWQRCGEPILFATDVVAEADEPVVVAPGMVAEVVEPDCFATKTAREILNKVTSLESVRDQLCLTGCKANESRILVNNVNSNRGMTYPSPLPTLLSVKDHLFMRRDNLVHFMPLNGDIISQTSKDLLDRKRFSLERIKQYQVNIGDAMAFPNDRYYIFLLFCKGTFQETLNFAHVESSLKSLKALIDSLNLRAFSVSKDLDSFSISEWNCVEDSFKRIFSDSQYIIMVCTGEIVTPSKSRRLQIIQECHESAAGGHRGMSKLYDHIREHFYWPGMGKEIAEFVRSCFTCQRNKIHSTRTRQPMRITDTPKHAFEKVQMDIVGPLPVTKKGNKYLLTLQDNLTKYSDAIPIPTIDSVTVALALAEQFISRFGCPRTIHTDQGRNFISQIMKNFCRIFKIQRITSTAFHPQSLGSLERAHRVFVDYLKHYCTKADWDDWIKFGMFSYNTSVHEATGFTPHELVFGVRALIPSEFAKEQISRTFVQHLDELFTKITTTQAKAAENLDRAKERSKMYYDRNRNPREFKVDDDVYLIKEPKTSKFDYNWLGPYKISRVFDDLNVELILGINKYKIVHTNKLKLACIRSDVSVSEH